MGRAIAARGLTLVYGGGNIGTMGALARAALDSGGRVVGVIPTALVEREWAHEGCDELHVVDTMHVRKRIMMERADAFLALPGGIGTFEELFEVWAWRQLGYHDKPVGILNAGGYYARMMDFVQDVVREGFMNEWQMSLVRVGEQAGPLLRELVQAAGFNPPAYPERL